MTEGGELISNWLLVWITICYAGFNLFMALPWHHDGLVLDDPAFSLALKTITVLPNDYLKPWLNILFRLGKSKFKFKAKAQAPAHLMGPLKTPFSPKGQSLGYLPWPKRRNKARGYTWGGVKLLKQEMLYCSPPISQSRCQLLWENILTSTLSPVGMTLWKHKKHDFVGNRPLWSCTTVYCKHNSAKSAFHYRHLSETMTFLF